MKVIDLIVGARPNLIKIASIISAMESNNAYKDRFTYRLVHTGQHYDEKMSESFFRDLSIPKPHFNLEVGSGTQSFQAAEIMIRYENLLMANKCDLCLVVGDVNSTMACAISSKKLGISLAHVEAGIRSGDILMPEEVNRLVTDSITDYFFTTTEDASNNLLNEGAKKENIFFVGNTMIDTLIANKDRFTSPQVWKDQDLESKEYLLLTLHRPSNVDDSENLRNIFGVICEEGKKVVFPVHPRTKAIMKNISNLPTNLILTEPMPYLQFNYLVQNSLGVITDSGGITEETTVLNIPCITIRDTTERPETVILGTNELVGSDPENIANAIRRMCSGDWKEGTVPPLWDGNSGKRIVEKLVNLFNEDE